MPIFWPADPITGLATGRREIQRVWPSARIWTELQEPAKIGSRRDGRLRGGAARWGRMTKCVILQVIKREEEFVLPSVVQIDYPRAKTQRGGVVIVDQR